MALLWPIIRMALANLNKVAVVDDRRQYTFKEILGGSLFLADQIEKLTSRTNIGMLLPTCGAMHLALLGAWMARRVAVPFNYLLTPDELAYIIEDSQVDTILTVAPMIEFLGGEQKLPSHIKLIYLEKLDFFGIPPLRWPPIIDDDELAALLYTSGTSAKPKGVMLTHGNLHANVDASIIHARITQSQIFLGVLPQFHSFGMTALTLIPLRGGCKAVYTARFIPKRIIELLREHRPSIFMAVPSMYGALLSLKEATADDFSSLKFAISGGEALPNAIFEAYLDRFKLHLLEGYGLTETSPVLNWSTPYAWKLHSVGKPLPKVKILILDENDRILPPGQDGEIVCAGPNIMKGYYRLPRQTERVFIDLEPPDQTDGRRLRFFRTGDIGKLDGDGFLYITGRKKEMLKVAGEIVYPREVEEVLNKHPAIRDSAVIGKLDGLRGEVPVAFVEVREDQTFNESAVRSWCRDKLAGYKVPREIRVVSLLPRSPTGKILKRHLRAD